MKKTWVKNTCNVFIAHVFIAYVFIVPVFNYHDFSEVQMDKEVVWFIRLSMLYFVLGSLLGVCFAVRPEMASPDYVSMHVHFNLLGWMSMMIFGVGYHVLPRFSGQPLYSRKLSIVQFWTANAGLLGMASGWGMKAHDIDGGQTLLAVFGTVMFVSILLFVYNLARTVKRPE